MKFITGTLIATTKDLPTTPPSSPQQLMVGASFVCGAEHIMCGSFNEPTCLLNCGQVSGSDSRIQFGF